MDSYQFALSLDTKDPAAAWKSPVNGTCSYEYTESNNPTPLYSQVMAAKGIDGSNNPFLLTYIYQTFTQDLRFKSLTLYGTLPNEFVGVYTDIVPSLQISVSGTLTTDVNPGNWVYLDNTAVECDINLDMNFSGPATVNFSVFDGSDGLLSQQTNPVNFVNGSGSSVLVLSQASDADYVTAQWMHGSGKGDVVTQGSTRTAQIDLNLCTTGDLDLNGTVDMSDFVIFASHWLK